MMLFIHLILQLQQCQVLVENLNKEIEDTIIEQSEHPDVASETLQEQLADIFGNSYTFSENSESLETLKKCMHLVRTLKSYIRREKQSQIEVLTPG